MALSTSISSEIGLINQPKQFISPSSGNTTPQLITDKISESLDNIIQTKPLSIPNYKNKLDRILKHKSTNAAPYNSSISLIYDDRIDANLILSPNLLVMNCNFESQ